MAREVYDVVGAGDTVTAYLRWCWPPAGRRAEAAVIANFAAGVEVGKLGAATVSAGRGARGVRLVHGVVVGRGLLDCLRAARNCI